MIQGFVEHFGYAAILALLVGAGVGLPLPEELTQLTAGFLAHQGYLRIVPAVAACWVAIVAGDFIFYSLARRLGEKVMESRPVRRVLTPRRRAWLERHFARHAFWTIVVARHTSGLRLPAFATADVRLSKDIPLHSDRIRAKFIAEAFNVTNRTNVTGRNATQFNLTAPTATVPTFVAVPNGVYGAPTSSGDPRIFQLALKFTF